MEWIKRLLRWWFICDCEENQPASVEARRRKAVTRCVMIVDGNITIDSSDSGEEMPKILEAALMRLSLVVSRLNDPDRCCDEIHETEAEASQCPGWGGNKH